MSAFFLAQKGHEELVNKAIMAFEYRGFRNKNIIKISVGTLLIYGKELANNKNYIFEPPYFVGAIGTPIYCGETYSESLKKILQDYRNGKLDTQKLIGNYVIILDNGSSGTIILDNNIMYKIFSNAERSYLSSSFLASVCCSGTEINHQAALEQLLCGFVSGTDTLAKGVYNIGPLLSSERLDWIELIRASYEHISKKKIGIYDSINLQVQGIKDYVSQCANLCDEYGAEAGLSGGCDSRLIYSSAHVCGVPLQSAHTHNTGSIHNKEIKSVEKLVEIYNTPLIKIPTHYLPNCESEHINDILRENVLYFDGRNAETIGAMSETHTRAYKKLSCNGNLVTFSGIGGEIYRDFYYTKLPIVFPKLWLEVHAFNLDVVDVIENNAYKEAVSKIISKVESELGYRITPCTTSKIAKLYFANHRIINDLSNVINANNQMSFYIAPFTDRRLIEDSFIGSHWHDQCGEYEGKIISAFNEAAASIRTSKGYSLDHVPMSIKFRWFIRSRCPLFLWIIRKKRDLKKQTMCVEDLAKKSAYFNTAVKAVFSVLPEIDKNVLPKCHINNSLVFSICSLYEISKLITHNK